MCSQVWAAVNEEDAHDGELPQLFNNEQDAWDSIAQSAYDDFNEYGHADLFGDDLDLADEEFQDNWMELFSNITEVVRIPVE